MGALPFVHVLIIPEGRCICDKSLLVIKQHVSVNKEANLNEPTAPVVSSGSVLHCVTKAKPPLIHQTGSWCLWEDDSSKWGISPGAFINAVTTATFHSLKRGSHYSPPILQCSSILEVYSSHSSRWLSLLQICEELWRVKNIFLKLPLIDRFTDEREGTLQWADEASLVWWRYQHLKNTEVHPRKAIIGLKEKHLGKMDWHKQK